MSSGDLVKREIIDAPQHYFAAQGKSLDARLENIKLTDEQEKEIQTGHLKKFVRDKALGLFKLGEIISEIINWNESVDEDLKEAKKEYLLSLYFDQNEQNEKSISDITKFLSNPQGNTLFNKILRILDDSPPDQELCRHLTHALERIVNSNFFQLFESHKYALSQIERLTPQALTILSDYKAWPLIPMGTYTATGPRVTSDWLSEFTQVYCGAKSIRESATVNRVRHSINELISMRLIEAHLAEEKKARCVITQVGQGLLPYISA